MRSLISPYYFYDVKKVYPYLRNKFIIATGIFVLFALFLDDNDIFTILSQHSKLDTLEEKKSEIQKQLDETIYTLDRLKYQSEVERFAREKKYFKKDNEDIFVVFYE